MGLAAIMVYRFGTGRNKGIGVNKGTSLKKYMGS